MTGLGGKHLEYQGLHNADQPRGGFQVLEEVGGGILVCWGVGKLGSRLNLSSPAFGSLPPQLPFSSWNFGFIRDRNGNFTIRGVCTHAHTHPPRGGLYHLPRGWGSEGDSGFGYMSLYVCQMHLIL